MLVLKPTGIDASIDYIKLKGNTKEKQEWIWSAWNEHLEGSGHTWDTIQQRRHSRMQSATCSNMAVTWHPTGQCFLSAAGTESLTLLRRKGISLNSVNRVDLQVTCTLPKPRPKLPSELYSAWTGELSAKARRMKKVLYRSESGETVYLGRRTSPRMLRVYDKGGQLSSHPLGTAFRFEIEYKRDLAEQVFDRLVEAGHGFEIVASTVCKYLLGMGVQLVVPDLGLDSAIATKVVEKEDEVESRVLWLRESVRPCITRLIRNGRIDDVLQALGLGYLKGD